MDKTLTNYLTDPTYDNKYCYLLIDMLGYVSEISPLHLDNIKENVKSDQIAIIARPELAYDLNACPHLIVIKAPNEKLNNKLVRASVGIVIREHLFTKNYICGWIVSEFPPQVLAQKCLDFGSQCGRLFNLPFLTFYEPFRMQLLQDCNGFFPHWLPSIINWCDSYFYADVSQTIRTIQPIRDFDPMDRVLTEEEKYYQQQAKNLLALYKAWNNIYLKLNKTTVSGNKAQLVKFCQYSYQARTLGINDVKDHDIFVLLSMKYGSLLNNEEIKNAILASQDEPGTLAERLKQIDIAKFVASSNKN